MIPERISIGQARTWNTCHRQWHYRHVDKLDETVTVDMRRGRAVHAALAAGNRLLVPSGRQPDPPPRPEHVRNAALAALAQSWEHERLDFTDGYVGACDMVDEHFTPDAVRRHVELGDVLAVEERFEFTVRGVTRDGVVRDAQASGIIDLVLAVPGGAEVVDYKTGTYVKAAYGDEQLGLYAAAWTATRRMDVVLGSLDYVAVGERPWASMDPDWVRRAVTYVLSARDEIEDARVFATSPEAVKCERCGFNQVCPDAIVPVELR